jgi:hypothetical protein
MNIHAIRELMKTGKYALNLRETPSGWLLQCRRDDSERAYELETKRGELRRFKTIDGAVKVVRREIGPYEVKVWIDDFDEIEF